MAHQLLRRPGLGCRTPTVLLCPSQLPRLHRVSSIVHVTKRLTRSGPSTAVSRVFRLAPCRAAAESDVADVMERPRSRFLVDTSPEIIEGADAPELPMPSEYQQTLWSSFTLAGIGLHTGEYACVRVRPAFAGEGRYFVRVPMGTNAGQAVAGSDMELQEQLMEELAEEEAALSDPEYRQQLVARYQEYIDAQEEEDFGGSFMDYLNAQECTELVQRLEQEGPPKFPFSEPEAPQPRSEDEEYVPASVAFLCGPNPVTTSLAKGDFQVAGVESLLSALEACGVDNARIEIEGGLELPVLDGSAEGWTDEICRSGLRYAPERADLPVKLPPGALEDDPLGALRGEAEGGEADEEGYEQEEDEEEDGEEEVAARGRRDGEESSSSSASSSSKPQAVPKLVLRPQSVISVVRGSSFVTLYPEDNFRITAGLDRHVEAPVIGKQWLSWCMFEDIHYKHSLSDARGFVSSPEQAMGMREAGWLMGGTEGVMLIGFGDRWYDPDVVRHDDEPVRRQIQDLIGDLSLLARDGHSGLPCGHIVSYDADHELNAAFLEKLLEATTEEDWVPIRNVAGPSVPIDFREMMRDVIAEPGEGEGEEEMYGEQGEEDEEEEEEGEYEQEGEMYGEGEEEEGEYGEQGEYDEDEDGGVVDVEATEVQGPRKGKGGRR